MIAPSKASVDAWQKLGDVGWDWETLKPYYQKFHTLALPSEATKEHLGIDYVDENVRGKSGPIQVSFPESQDPLAKAWVETFKALKYQISGDPFSGQVTGGFCNSATIDPKTKERSYSASAYYAPVSNRSNLHVITEAFVERIVLEKSADGIIARGAQYTRQGETQTVHAQKEVILAAGAFQSPQLLELSGIGDAGLLESHAVPVYIDNRNVGENLQDHLMSGISYEVVDGTATMDVLRQDPDASRAAMQEYMSSKTGPLVGSGAIGAFAFMPIVDFLTQDGSKTLENLLDEHFRHDHTKTSSGENLHHDFIRSILKSPDEASASLFMSPLFAQLHTIPLDQPAPDQVPPGNYVTLLASLLHPFSHGSVHINSSDPTCKPTVDPKYFSHPLDIELFARHLQYLETIAETAPLASFIKPGGRRSTSSVKDLHKAKAFLRASCISNWHPTSTCAMMPREIGGVVDARLIVHGTKNLRVVDASVIPIVPRGNPQSTVYAVAERAADIIKEDHGLAS